MRAALAPHELTHVQFVLLASLWWLGEHGEPPTQRELADHAGTDAMMTSQVVRRLEARALLIRTADSRDTRVRRLALTPAGRTLLAAALTDVETTDAAVFAALGADQPLFVAALATLLADLTEG